MFGFHGRHAATVVGRGWAGAVDYRLLQANQCLSCHITGRIDGIVQCRLSRKDVWPVEIDKAQYILHLALFTKL